MSRWFLAVALGGNILATAAPAVAQTAAKIETAPLDLMPPERFRVPNALEPSRHVGLTALEDAVVKVITTPVGTMVKQGQEVARLDSTEADARLKVATALVAQKQAAVDSVHEVKANKATLAQAEADLEAAKAEQEIARMRVDRCTLRAPYNGRILATPLDLGQYVAKGSPVAELADLTTLRAVVPVLRGGFQVGGAIPLVIEGKAVQGRVKAILPPPANFAPLADLAAPLAAAVVEIANPDGSLEPGLRVRGPWALNGPVTVLPSMAVQTSSTGGNGVAIVQVIRNEYVTDIPVQVLGEVGPERLQVSGLFRSGDSAVVSSSLPLTDKTLVRFGPADPSGGVQAQPPASPSGGMASVDVPAPANPGIAPIGSPGAATSKAAAKGGSGGSPATKPATKSGGTTKGGVPF